MIQTNQYFQHLKVFSIIVFLSVIGSLFLSHNVEAATITSPTQLPGIYQNLISDYDSGKSGDCYGSPPHQEMIITYLSTQADPSTLLGDTTVTAGTTVNLQLNFGIFICKANSNQAGTKYASPLPPNGSFTRNLSSASWYVSTVYQIPPSASCIGGSVTSTVDTVIVSQPDPGGNNDRYWFGSHPFSYAVPSGCSGTGSINATVQEANTFNGVTVICGAPGAAAVGVLTSCPSQTLSGNYNIVTPPVVTASCATRSFDISYNDPYDTTAYSYSIDSGSAIITTAIPPGWSFPSPFIDMSGQDQTVSHALTLLIGHYDSSGNFIQNKATSIPDYPACYTVGCSSVTASAVLGVSSSIFASVQFTPINGAGPPPPSNIGPGAITSMTIGQTGSIPATIGPNTPTSTGTGSASFSFTIPSTWSPGSFSISFSYSGAGGISCTGSGTVTSQPYFSVNGGDVVAGSNLNTLNNCSALNTGANAKNAGIIGFNTNTVSGPVTYGAGTTLAAQALGQIIGFNTNTLLTGSGYPPTSFIFANSSGLAAATLTQKPTDLPLKGFFGDAPCSPVISEPTTTITASTVSTAPADSATYTVNVTINGFTMPKGNKATIYVKGNVYITGDISYTTGWSSLSDIPSLKIVSMGGNIYIDPTVKNLEGTYMAIQGSTGTGGAIYDCSTDSLAGKYPANPATGNNQCFDNTLTINGSFIAHDVYLQRTKGNAATNSGAAEQFNYGPEQWLSSPTSTSSSIESIQTLPPVF